MSRPIEFVQREIHCLFRLIHRRFPHRAVHYLMKSFGDTINRFSIDIHQCNVASNSAQLMLLLEKKMIGIMSQLCKRSKNVFVKPKLKQFQSRKREKWFGNMVKMILERFFIKEFKNNNLPDLPTLTFPNTAIRTRCSGFLSSAFIVI